MTTETIEELHSTEDTSTETSGKTWEHHFTGIQTAKTRVSEHCNSSIVEVLNKVAAHYANFSKAISRPSDLQELSNRYSFQSQTVSACTVQLKRHCDTVSDTIKRLEKAHQRAQKVATNNYNKCLAYRKQYIQNANEAHALLQGIPELNTKRIASKLASVRNSKSKYKQYVSASNASLQQYRLLERMALQTCQQLAEDRMDVVALYLRHIVRLKQQRTDDYGDHPSESSSSPVRTPEKQPPSNNNNINSPFRKFSWSASAMESEHGEPLAAMEVESLGLDIAVGELRDRARAEADVQLELLQQTRTVNGTVQTVLVAAQTLGTALTALLASMSTSSGSLSFASVSDEMGLYEESPYIQHLWKQITTLMEREAASALGLAQTLQSLKVDQIDAILQYGDKSLTPASERDDASWKQLCEAARSNTKAVSKHRESQTQTARVRDRVASMDGNSGNSSSPSAATSQMSQSLANMFSILPNGGEHAMKVLDPTTRASVAQISLGDAQKNEAKTRQVLQAAAELTNLSLEAYKSSAETLLKVSEEKILVAPIEGALVAALEQFQTSSFESASEESSSESQTLARTTVQMWADTVARTEETRPDDELELLGVVEAESESVQKALSAPGDGGEDAPSVVSMDASFEVDSGGGKDAFSTPTKSHDSDDNSQISSWLRSDSFFGKMTINKKPARPFDQPDGSTDPETSIFVKYFWPEDADESKIPNVKSSYACSFRDGGQKLPFQYGRLFLTEARLIFVGWTRKQLCLKWKEVLSVESVDNPSKLKGKTLVVSCKKSSATEQSCMVLSSFFEVEEALDEINALKSQRKESRGLSDTEVSVQSPLNFGDNAEVPPDATLSKMNVIITQKIHNLTILKFYEIVWSNERPFYGPWLERECMDVQVGDWEKKAVTGRWCKEEYSQKRTVKFKVKRKTHLYIGPPIASVTQVSSRSFSSFMPWFRSGLPHTSFPSYCLQTHYCRMEGDDKCVLAMTAECEGIPYGDTFVVHVRWVARRKGPDILVEVGLDVEFLKNTMLKGSIRSGALEETTSIHKDLFAAIQKACAEETGEELEVAEDLEPIVAVKKVDWFGLLMTNYKLVACCLFFILIWGNFLFAGTREEVAARDLVTLHSRMDGLESEVKAIRETLDKILAHLDGS